MITPRGGVAARRAGAPPADAAIAGAGSATVNATSWDQQMLMVVLPGGSMRVADAELRNLVERFVQDWWAVH